MKREWASLNPVVGRDRYAEHSGAPLLRHRRLCGVVGCGARLARSQAQGRGDSARSRRSRLNRWSSALLKDIVDVHVLDYYRLRLRFENGVEGDVDVARLV